jgi:hypothetical protein
MKSIERHQTDLFPDNWMLEQGNGVLTQSVFAENSSEVIVAGDSTNPSRVRSTGTKCKSYGLVAG